MKQDKRSKRTRAWLLDTLLELIETKEYSEISITELTEKSDIARQTFYRNYNSIDDILLFKMDEIRDEYMAEVQKNLETKHDPSWDFEVNQMITLWQQNESLFRALQKAGLIFQALDKFTEIFSVLHMKLQNLEELDEKHKYLVYYLSGGVYMVFNKWFLNGMTFPIDSLTDLFKKAAENVNQISREYMGS
jgi:AcrR family transcriptional regulator